MKPQLLSDPFRNPFYNRFNDPVQRRRDDMQSHEYTVWLRDRNRAMSFPSPAISRDGDGGLEPKHSRMFAGILAISVFFAISAAVLTFALR
jgi:hypothetical protein